MLLAKRTRHRPTRQGTVALEMLLVLPVLLTVILAMVEFGMLMSAQEQLVAASREGGRVAALGGGPEEIMEAVQRHLGPGALSGASVEMNIADASGNPLPSGESVQVWVSIPASAASPDLLSFLGYSIQNEMLLAQTTMRKE